MKIYATTDTHFNHAMLVNNGHRDAGFEQPLLKNIGKVQGDVFLHLGDVTMGNDRMWHELLLATIGKNFKRKILVRGNHDSRSYSWYLDRGWDWVCEFMQMRIEGKEVLFSHMPLMVEDTKQELYHQAVVNFHGHLHGGGRYSHRYVEGYNGVFNYDIAPDTHDMKPVNINALLAKIITENEQTQKTRE